MDQTIKQKYQRWKKSERKVVEGKLTYRLKKIQRGQSMQQRNLQKKKDFATLLEKKIAEKKYLRKLWCNW